MRHSLLFAWLLAVGSSGALAQTVDLVPGPTSTPGFDAATHVPAAHFGTLPLLYSNGGLATGTTTGSGVAVPTAGYQWSEVQADAGNTTESNTNAGFSCSVTTTTIFRCADDFTIPVGETWTIEAVAAFAYQTGYAGVASPIVSGTLQIWDGPPNDPGSTILFGDTSTNRLLTSFEANLYRVFNTTTPPPGSAPGTTRRIWENVLAVSPTLSLPAGTYWVDFNTTVTANAAHFTPAVTTPGTRGVPGANALQFTGAGWVATIDTGNPATAPDVPQDFPIQIYGTSVAPTYTVTAPAPGPVLIAGARTVVRWNGAGVPDRNVDVDVFLRKGAGPEVLVGSGPNRGRLKVTIPAVAVSGSDYTFVVRLQSDPSVFGASAAVAVSNTAEQYTFSEPDANESWARGFLRTVVWTTPPTAPTGTVTLTLQRDNGTVIFSAAGEPDDGSFDYAIPSNLATGNDVFFTITNEADGAFLGRSPAFDIVRIEPSIPFEGDTWTVGTQQIVAWNGGAANANGVVRLSLRGVSNGYSRSLASNVPYPNELAFITVPSTGNVPPPGQYFVQLLYTYTPPGGSEVRYVSNSNVFTVVNPAAPVVVERHFASPLAAEDTRETLVAVRGLGEGAEVGVFAPMGDGTPVLLASGVVEAGEALIAVPSDIVDGDGELAFGAGTTLTLRAVDGGVESALEASSVTLGEGAVASAVRFTAGEVVTVTVSKDAAGGATDALALVGVMPNPTSGTASVRFTLSSSEAVTVTVYDVLGRVVATLFDGTAPAGASAVPVPAGLNAGVYVVRVSTESTSAASRFTVIR